MFYTFGYVSYSYINKGGNYEYKYQKKSLLLTVDMGTTTTTSLGER